jgi:AraC family transcriptional activator of tynA and feaB
LNVLHSGDLADASRVTTWNTMVATRLIGMDFAPARGVPFVASLVDSDLGPLRIARLAVSRSVVERKASHIAVRHAPAYLILIQLTGAGEIGHYGTVATLQAGDMILCDAAAPLKLTFDDAAELLVLRVPAAMLKEHLPSPECFCGRPLRGSECITSTAATMASTLFDHLVAGLSVQYQERVARHLLDVVGTAHALAIQTPEPRSSIVSGRCATVKLFIEQHLRDPDLTPCSVAARLKLSPRYLRMIFASENETVSAYILRRRLEHCARQIADPAWRGHSMTEIAFGWGFNSAPHFTRSFRDRFDMPPRDYRRLKLGEGEGAHRRPAATTRLPAAYAA